MKTNGTRRAGTHHTAAVKNRHRERYSRAKGLRVGLGSGSQSLRPVMCALYPPQVPPRATSLSRLLAKVVPDPCALGAPAAPVRPARCAPGDKCERYCQKNNKAADRRNFWQRLYEGRVILIVLAKKVVY